MFLLKSSKKNLFSRKSIERNISFFNKKNNIDKNDTKNDTKNNKNNTKNNTKNDTKNNNDINNDINNDTNNDTNNENNDKNNIDYLIYYIEILTQKTARLNTEIYILENKMLELQTKYNNELSIIKLHKNKQNSFKNRHNKKIIFIKKIKIYVILLNLLYFINNYIKYI